MSSGTKVYESAAQPARIDAVVEAIAKTEKIIMLSGPEVSVASGMPVSSTGYATTAGAYLGST